MKDFDEYFVFPEESTEYLFEEFIANAIIIDVATIKHKEREIKGLKEIVLYDITKKSLFTMNSSAKGFNKFPSVGEVYKVQGVRDYKISAYTNCQVVKYIGKANIYDFFKKFKYCIDYPEVDFNFVCNTEINDEQYFLVNFTGTTIKKKRGKYGHKYQIKLGETYLDLVNYKCLEFPEYENRIFKGRAIVKAFKMKNGQTGYKVIKLFGNVKSEEEWIQHDEKCKLGILKGELVGTIEDLTHINFEVKETISRNYKDELEECIKDNEFLEHFSDVYDDDWGPDDLSDSYYEYNSYDNDSEDYEDVYDNYESYDDYSGEMDGGYVSAYERAIINEHEQLEKEYFEEMAKDYDPWKEMDLELEKKLIEHLNKSGFNNKFYVVTDITDDKFAVDYSMKATKLEDIPGDVRRWLDNLIYIKEQNKIIFP